MTLSESGHTLSPAVERRRRAGPFDSRTLNRHVWYLAIPAVGENLLHTLLMIVDTLMIARVSTAALAASAVAGTILWRVHATFGSIEKGATAMVARYYGEGDSERVGKTVAQSIYIAVGIGGLMAAVGYWMAPQFYSWMGTESAVARVGVPYLQVVFLVSIARLLFYVAGASVRGAGDTRTPMWITLWMNLINIIFNYLLIFGHFGFPRLGLLGSGISTAIALVFSAVAILWVMFRGRTQFALRARHFVPDFAIMRRMVVISFPAFLDELIVTAGYLIFFRYIAVMGTDVLAAHTISTRIESVSFMAGLGFSVAAATMVGQSLGMGRTGLAKKSFRRNTGYCALVMSGVAFFLIISADLLVGAFRPTEEVHNLARVLLIIAAVEQPLLGITMALSGGLRGAGDTISPMISSIIGNILVRVGVVYWFAFGLGWGIYGVYLGTVVDWLVRAAILFYFYRRGRWRRIVI